MTLSSGRAHWNCFQYIASFAGKYFYLTWVWFWYYHILSTLQCILWSCCMLHAPVPSVILLFWRTCGDLWMFLFLSAIYFSYWRDNIIKFISYIIFITTLKFTFISGAITIPGSGGGMIFGGYMVKKLNLRLRGIIYFCCICVGLAALLGPSFLASCPSQPVAGVSTYYNV